MTNEQTQELIHIDWSGPHSLKEVESFNDPTDYGVYQIYGSHHVYGSSVLLYIGRVVDQTFAARFRQHTGFCCSNKDARRVEIYLGRLWGSAQPDNETWNRQIEIAERLLIYVHEPAQNAQKELNGLEVGHVHVINYNCYRDLLPEVSGAAWAGPGSSGFRHFGSTL